MAKPTLSCSHGALALHAGQMAVQGNVGGGSFVCGLRRILSEHHTLEFQGAVGELPGGFCPALGS